MVVFVMNNSSFYFRIDHSLIQPIFEYGLKILFKFYYWFYQNIYTWQTEWQSSPLPVASNWNISEHNNFLITHQFLSIYNIGTCNSYHTFELRPSPLVFLVNSFSTIFQLLGMTWLLAIQFQLVSKCKNYSSKRHSTSYILPSDHKLCEKLQISFNLPLGKC